MMSFRKWYNLKVLCIAISFLLLFTNTPYSFSSPDDTLRLPVGKNDDRLNRLLIALLDNMDPYELRERFQEANKLNQIQWISKFKQWEQLETEKEKFLVGGIFILRKIKGEWCVLFGQRKDPPYEYMAGPGGRVENGESSINASLRETAEEADITIITGDLSGRVDDFCGEHDGILASFWVYIDYLETPVVKETRELNNYQWIPLSLIMSSSPEDVGERVELFLKKSAPGCKLMHGFKVAGIRNLQKLVKNAIRGHEERTIKQKIELTFIPIETSNCLPKNDIQWQKVEAQWDEEKYQRMRKRREYFKYHKDEFINRAELYWKKVIERFCGDIIYLNNFENTAKPKVSVCMVTIASRFNNLFTRLDEIRNQDHRENLEIIIVLANPDKFDNDMVKKIMKKLAQTGFPAAIIKSKENVLPISLNLGRRYSKGEIFLQWDDDVSIRGKSINELLKVFDENEEIGLLGVTLFSPDGTRIRRPQRYQLKKFWGNSNIVITDSVYGSFLAIRSELIKSFPYPIGYRALGPDIYFSSLVLDKIGYIGAYLVSTDLYVLDDETYDRYTKSSNRNFSLIRNIVNKSIDTYVIGLPNEYNKMVWAYWLGLWSKDPVIYSEILEFFDRFLELLPKFFKHDPDTFESFTKDNMDNHFIKVNKEQIEKAIKYLKEFREEIREYKEIFSPDANIAVDIDTESHNEQSLFPFKVIIPDVKQQKLIPPNRKQQTEL